MISRRQVLLGFSGLAFGGSVSGIVSTFTTDAGDLGAQYWRARSLEPMECARLAYQGYWEENGGCGFAVFKGIVGMMGMRYGAPYATFPLWMMSYASGGIAGWGTVCGALNCAAASFGLFYDRKALAPLVDALFSWYETAELPEFIPDDPIVPVDVERTVTKSVLCHAALSRWSYITGHKISSNECRERCSRVAADVTRKTVEILNAKIEGNPPVPTLSAAYMACSKCHSKGRDADCSRTKMDCSFLS
jgi:hypothetical protein